MSWNESKFCLRISYENSFFFRPRFLGAFVSEEVIVIDASWQSEEEQPLEERSELDDDVSE